MADRPVMEGKLHVKQNKFGKKWKRCYALLYPDSSFGVARLEFYDWKDGTLAGEKIYTRKAADRKVVRLVDCIRVAPAPTESGHKENMAAFIIETAEKTMLLSAERATCEDWVLRLGEMAFSGSSSDVRSSTESPDSTSLEMAVNSIYLSREEAVSEFRVTVQRTEAAERCSLRGSYILRTENDCLILKDATGKENLYAWPYKLLRRYGRDKVMFSFEAGRRCASGPGNFTFETSQGHEIFQKVESSIRAQQGSENRLSCPALDAETPTDVSPLGSDSGRYEGLPVALARKEAEEKALRGRGLPNLPTVKSPQSPHLLDPSIPAKSSTPPRSPVHHNSPDSEHLAVYSEPKDSVKGARTHFDPLYSDPVDTVRSMDTRSDKESVSSPLYSDLYDRVGYEVVGGNLPPKALGSLNPPPLGGEEHIYDEPEGMVQTSNPPQLYSEVCMEAAAWKKQSSDDKLGYEYPYNPNMDDYSVPNFQAPRSRTGPKPVPAPKPLGMIPPKPSIKERVQEKAQSPTTQQPNSNNNNNIEALYSQVIKPGKSPLKQAVNQDLSAPPVPIANQLRSTSPLPMTNQLRSTSPLSMTNQLRSTPPLPTAGQLQAPPPVPAATQLRSTSPLPMANQLRSTPPLPTASQLQATSPLPTANQSRSTPPLLTANQPHSVPPPLPPMNKPHSAPPLPPPNKVQSMPLQPPIIKPQPILPPAKLQSSSLQAKTQPLPIPLSSKTLPPLPSPGKLQTEPPPTSDTENGLGNNTSVIYEDMGFL